MNAYGALRLSGLQRCAGLLVVLGPEISGKVLAHFPEEDIKRLSWEVTNLNTLSKETCETLVEEAYNAVVDMQYGPRGGIDAAIEILEHALGPDRAREIGNRIRASIQEVPFAFVHDLDPGQLAAYLCSEHPQTVALVLSYVPSDRAAAIMAQLPGELRGDVARRMVSLDGAAPEVVRAVESKMMQALSTALALRHEVSPAGGLASLVSLLKSSDRATEHEILQSLGEVDPALVEAIKQQMFVFENIVQLDDRSIQRVLRDVDSRDLMVALKGAPENVRRTVMRNMSSRASATLDDDLATMGPVRLSAVQAAQGNIVTIIRRLDEAEEIVISRGDVVG